MPTAATRSADCRRLARPPHSAPSSATLSALARIEAVPQPADELADALAVRAEVTQGAADGPRRPLQGHRDLARGGGAAHAREGAPPARRRSSGSCPTPAPGARPVPRRGRAPGGRSSRRRRRRRTPRRSGDRAAEAAAGDQSPEGRGAVGGERLPGEVADRASAAARRPAPPASVPTNRAARTQSGSAASAGESSSSARRQQLGGHDVARGRA